MESDADRLASIKALGGQVVQTPAGPLWAIFDAAGARVQFEEVHFNSENAQLTMRSSDAELLGAAKRGVPITVARDKYVVREQLAGDAPGWSVLTLDKP